MLPEMLCQPFERHKSDAEGFDRRPGAAAFSRTNEKIVSINSSGRFERDIPILTLTRGSNQSSYRKE